MEAAIDIVGKLYLGYRSSTSRPDLELMIVAMFNNRKHLKLAVSIQAQAARVDYQSMDLRRATYRYVE